MTSVTRAITYLKMVKKLKKVTYRESNPGPLDGESRAIPLCYGGQRKVIFVHIFFRDL